MVGRIPARRRLVVLGAGLMTLGVLLFSLVTRWLVRLPQYPQYPIVADGAFFGGIALFASGWVLVGTGLRRQQNPRSGALWAAVLYVAVGIGWLGSYVSYTVLSGERLLTSWATPVALLLAVLWPWYVAAVLGVFGLGLR